MDDPTPKTLWDRLRQRRRLLQVLFFVGLGLMVVRMVRLQPVEVEVVYDFGAANPGLTRAELRYLHEGEEVRRVTFDYRRQPVGVVQRHTVELLRGDYTVEALLVFDAEVPKRVPGQRLELASGDPATKVQRPLLVRSAGEVTIHF